ncbi:MAG: triose-phosphate isomerase [Syntrophaceae bacterium]|nr:triose-phosphate isomerase [Syntrophaceae bacterium]
MPRPLIAGNWKMHMNVGEAVDYARRLRELFPESIDRDIAIAPPFTALWPVSRVLADSPVGVGAQNVCDEPKGAFTGEISAGMLADAGCRYVIVGHSERRKIFGEEDSRINRKLIAVLKAGLTPILCVGETLDQREAGDAFSVIAGQINAGLKNLDAGDIGRCIVAYEPVWAIGTGRTATPEQAEEVHAFIRCRVAALFGETQSVDLTILYGGSVTPENIDRLMESKEINGALVGGASLNIESFSRIIRYQQG